MHGEMRNSHEILVPKPENRDHLGDMIIDGIKLN
jgi:hypothetical protein